MNVGGSSISSKTSSMMEPLKTRHPNQIPIPTGFQSMPKLLKPIVQEPKEDGVHYIEDVEYEWTIKRGDLVDEWLEREAAELHAENQLEPGNEIMGALQVDDEWLIAHVDHTNVNNAEWEWDPTPNKWQMIEKEDLLDYVTLPLLFTNYEYEFAHDRASLRLFRQPPENLEDFFRNVEYCPQICIISDLLPKSIVHIPNMPCISVIQGLWEDDDTVDLYVEREE
ncbi:hypothetical protein RHSIM_Rhsim03G0128500 [Rhododendron simsii]|uniref:Uncharacterized protein n=1 Tax=Rhododendron simsii TaxID=118357 RepID=A0A834H401_RHOSS|nr:hypothetical protein RHSIM_Rhsim03G0128500 [Rhododendron simsii]